MGFNNHARESLNIAGKKRYWFPSCSFFLQKLTHISCVAFIFHFYLKIVLRCPKCAVFLAPLAEGQRAIVMAW